MRHEVVFEVVLATKVASLGRTAHMHSKESMMDRTWLMDPPRSRSPDV
jgi:hypothetical protein